MSKVIEEGTVGELDIAPLPARSVAGRDRRLARAEIAGCASHSSYHAGGNTEVSAQQREDIAVGQAQTIGPQNLP